jgi:hypothetical protein
MKSRPDKFFEQAFAWMAARTVLRFRLAYAVVLVFLGIAAVGGFALFHWWVGLLCLVLLVLAISFRTRISRAFETEQAEIWQRVHQFIEHARVEQDHGDEPQDDEVSNWSNDVTTDSSRAKLWNYADAMKAVPYVRVILRELRESYFKVWHLYRLNEETGMHEAEMKSLKANGLAALDELARLGVLCFERPSRGIALFRFLVSMGDGRTRIQREAWYVFKDSRDSIDSFVFDDELMSGDLFGYEMPVPAAWKKPNAIPHLD